VYCNLDDSLILRTEGTPEETIESAGCTGGCEAYKDGLPDCEKCSQFDGGVMTSKKFFQKIANHIGHSVEYVKSELDLNYCVFFDRGTIIVSNSIRCLSEDGVISLSWAGTNQGGESRMTKFPGWMTKLPISSKFYRATHPSTAGVSFIRCQDNSLGEYVAFLYTDDYAHTYAVVKKHCFPGERDRTIYELIVELLG